VGADALSERGIGVPEQFRNDPFGDTLREAEGCRGAAQVMEANIWQAKGADDALK
jgi:hypothetical protein